MSAEITINMQLFGIFFIIGILYSDSDQALNRQCREKIFFLQSVSFYLGTKQYFSFFIKLFIYSLFFIILQIQAVYLFYKSGQLYKSTVLSSSLFYTRAGLAYFITCAGHFFQYGRRPQPPLPNLKAPQLPRPRLCCVAGVWLPPPPPYLPPCHHLPVLLPVGHCWRSLGPALSSARGGTFGSGLLDWRPPPR